MNDMLEIFYKMSFCHNITYVKTTSYLACCQFFYGMSRTCCLSGVVLACYMVLQNVTCTTKCHGPQRVPFHAFCWCAFHLHWSQKPNFHHTFNCSHVLWWHLYVEEYGPTILYHPGKKNVIANTFSQILHCDVLPIPDGENAPVVLFDFTSIGLDIINDPDFLECFLNLSLPDVTEKNPVDLKGQLLQEFGQGRF